MPSTILAVVGPLLAFGTALLAIRKPETWRGDRSGLRRLSAFGWVALTLAVVALGINSYTVLKARADVRRARLARQQIEEIACQEIVGHLITLKSTLEVLNRLRVPDSDPVVSATLRQGSSIPYSIMSGDAAIQELAQVSLLPRIEVRRSPWGYGPRYADDIIAEGAAEARAGLDRVTAKYSSFLDEGDLIALGRLANSRLLKDMVAIRERVLDTQQNFETNVPVRLVDQRLPDRYSDFVAQLWALHCRVVTIMRNDSARSNLECDDNA